MFMYVGAMRTVRRNTHRFDLRNIRVYGCSVGAFAALLMLLVLNDIISVDEIEHELECAFGCANRFSFDFTPVALALLETLFAKYLGCVPILKLVNRRLHIGVSSVATFAFVHKYKTTHDLCRALMLSVNLPMFSSYSRMYLDGGIRFELKHLPKNTFVVYNLTYFPESCIVPDVEKKRKLVAYGVDFTSDYLCNKRGLYDRNMHMNENRYTEALVRTMFAVHHAITSENAEWSERLLCMHQRRLTKRNQPFTARPRRRRTGAVEFESLHSAAEDRRR